MAVQALAGSSIAISAGRPTTWDAAGYAALTYSVIGEVTDMPAIGRVYSPVNHNPVAERSTVQLKGSYTEGNATISLAVDPDDAGQTLAQTASESDAQYSFKITRQDGSIQYFSALVASFNYQGGGVDTIYSATIDLWLQTNEDTGIISVAAA